LQHLFSKSTGGLLLLGVEAPGGPFPATEA